MKLLNQSGCLSYEIIDGRVDHWLIITVTFPVALLYKLYILLSSCHTL